MSRPDRDLYWEQVEDYWAGYLEAYDRFLRARQDSPEQRRARADMRRELALRMAVEGRPL